MDKLDIYYRALVDYRKYTRENTDCARRRKSVINANRDGDVIEIIKTECDIEEDWIAAIETGLDFIGKAIAEERQFILSNGEILSIEKVKSVSRESVEHLAKHSNLLTRVPKKGEDLIPDKLYSVERLTDYAVYENRFLYMLLNYLKEFISVRYDEITELTTTYTGKMTMRKTVSTGNRQLVYEVTLDEKVRGDEYLKASNPSKDKIDRIDGLLKAVVSYLAMPIMDEVAKAPMLKPPITETNVLKMNRNFKAAMQLYYFITSYTKKGYSFRQNVRRINPFKDDMADEFAETAELSSFLTYEYGMDLQDTLKVNYERQLEEEKLAEEARRTEQIKSLRKRIRESGGNAEEYMLLLEQRIKTLEEETVQLGAARAEVERLGGVVEKLNGDIARLNEEISGYDEIITQKDNEIADLKYEHEAEVAQLNESHAAELARKEEECAEKVAEMEEEYSRKTREVILEYGAKTEAVRLTASLERKSLEAVIKQGEDRYAQLQEELNRVRSSIDDVERERLMAVAALNAIKQKHDDFTGDEDYTSREGCDELETQLRCVKERYEQLKALFKVQWGRTKRDIRKKYLRADAATPAEDGEDTVDASAAEDTDYTESAEAETVLNEDTEDAVDAVDAEDAVDVEDSGVTDNSEEDE